MSTPTPEQVEELFRRFSAALRAAIVDHKIDVILGRPPEKLAEYFVSCLASLSELQRKE